MYQQSIQNKQAITHASAATVTQNAKSMPAVPAVEIRNQVVQRAKDVVKGEYTLTINDEAFEAEALEIWGFIVSKDLTAALADKKIHIIKTPGKAEKVCHHWSFGGLNAAFSSNIEEIHGLLEGSEAPLLIDGEDIGLKSRDWNTIAKPDGLAALGTVADTQITMYDDTAHSSRQKDGLWYHKFIDKSHIFAIEGYSGNLGYGSQKTITVGALAESGLGDASWFQYKKTPEA
ncbi:hypothetical protein [Sediminibacterium ginsengisoli]|uniref:Uncharacterized protein n=1 Tax=Sediminibacterium ginsengisoli TaxID=413434 RepID=A0A1T4LAA0_9BACT|nr:hypothetical protein [Sediminibacterium ginsengisoli]SJZ51427.1 hypothetical protein SAMN04488132_102386 [Sediminibacterium ginsengisoli]